MACAFETLSPLMQQWLETLDVIHAAPPGQRATLGLSAASPEVQEV
jgi:hypothetical protein